MTTFCTWAAYNHEKIIQHDERLGQFVEDMVQDMEWPNGDELEIFISHIMNTWGWAVADDIDQCKRLWDLRQWDTAVRKMGRHVDSLDED